MSDAPFTIERVSHGREYELVYQEGDRELRLWMEIAGSGGPYDRTTVRESLDSWTTPAGVAIPEVDRTAIRARLEAWELARGTRIGFVESQSIEEQLAQMERDGWTRRIGVDGVLTMAPPSRRRLPGRLWQRLGERPMLELATRAAWWGALVGLLCGALYAGVGFVHDLVTTGLTFGTALAFLALPGMPALLGAAGFVVGLLLGGVRRLFGATPPTDG